MTVTAAETKQRVHRLMPQAKTDLAELVAIPSIADPQQYPRQNCLDAADLVARHFRELGFTQLDLHEMSDGYPAVFGERRVHADAPTVLLYAHYDVQPPLDEAAWKTPPFELTERRGRW